VYTRQRKVLTVFVFGFLCLNGAVSTAQQAKKPFTVSDDIGLAEFGDPFMWQAKAVRFSPDGNYFAVDTERGRLDVNRPEDSLRFYRTKDAKTFLDHSGELPFPSPVWTFSLSTDREGPIIKEWRWLADSSGVAFLQRMRDGHHRLVLADIRRQKIESLTSATEIIKGFDVRDRQHYVYLVADEIEGRKWQAERQGAAVVGTGRSLMELLFPDVAVTGVVSVSSSYRNLRLYVVAAGKRFELKKDGVPFILFSQDVALSPDGRSLVTTLPVSDVPSSWDTLYPPPFASSRFRIGSTPQDLHSGANSAHQYVRIDLQTGSVQSLTDAPISTDAGWWAGGSPSWSNDGQEVLLPNTFLSSKDNAPSRPCVAVVDLPSNGHSCVELLKGQTETGFEEGYHAIMGARFAGGDKRRVIVTYLNHKDRSLENVEYRRALGGTWLVAGESKVDPEGQHDDLEIVVKQSFDDPPVLVAKNKQTSQVIWDPNPQLKNIDLGQASVYTWRDKDGLERRAGLYKPSNYRAGVRYPLVIQTHGFEESNFFPSGAYPTAFAARELAAAGIVVLQVGAVAACREMALDEGRCNASGYEFVANQLVSQGLADPERIGIIGFSRTCFDVMEMLTTGSLHLKAASITDGVMETYFQYLMQPGTARERTPESDSVIGAKPFGEGLKQWLKRSPGFNLDKVAAPILVVGEGPVSLLFIWEAYAGLRLLHKPVDLIMLNTDEHVLTNPAVRMASQGGSVDWFRFWLQDYEDPDPAKAEQYKRWRELKKM